MKQWMILLGLLDALLGIWLCVIVAHMRQPVGLIESGTLILVFANVATLWWVAFKSLSNTTGRLAKLFHLWLDAKEAELKKKAGA